MPILLSGFVNNLSEKVHGNKCTDCKSCLDFMSVKNDQLIFKFLKCKKNQNKNINKDLINRFGNTNKFHDGDINKFTFFVEKRNLSI